MGFTKLDEHILQSSIMAEKPDVFKVWIAILASCESDGIAKVSAVFLAAACHLPLKVVDRAIEILSAPDAHSRSLAEDGRRIKRVDGGYFVINYEKYRAFTPAEGDPNSPGAIRTRRWREKRFDNVTGSPVVTGGDACDVTSASASASASVDSKRGERGRIRLILDESPKRWEGIADEDKALWAKTYPGCNVEVVLQEMIAYWDGQPPAKRKVNWKAAIVNRFKWLQDHGGSAPRGRSDDFNSQLDAWVRREAK